MKTFIIVLIVIGILGLGGGAYWYLTIYQPTNYVETFIQFEQEMKASIGEFNSTSNIKDSKDYIGALETIRLSKNLNEEFQGQLSLLSPPFFGKGKQIHKDTLKVIEYTSAIINDTEQRVLFFTQIKELSDLLKTSPETKSTIGETTKSLEDLVGQIKILGNELFQKEPCQLSGEVSYNELRLAWEEGRPVMDMMLTFARSHDPDLPTDRIGKFPKTEVEKEAQEKFGKFRKLIESVAKGNTIDSILSFRSPQNVLQEEEISRLNSRVKETLNDLKNKYSL